MRVWLQNLQVKFDEDFSVTGCVAGGGFVPCLILQWACRRSYLKKNGCVIIEKKRKSLLILCISIKAKVWRESMSNKCHTCRSDCHRGRNWIVFLRSINFKGSQFSKNLDQFKSILTNDLVFWNRDQSKLNLFSTTRQLQSAAWLLGCLRNAFLERQEES